MTQNLAHQLFKDLAIEHGFSLSGICRAEIDSTAIQRFLKWLEEKHDGEMDWIRKRTSERINPQQYLENAKSVLVVAKFYSPQPAGKDIKIASYIRGEDYHDILKSELHQIAKKLSDKYNNQFTYRVCVDTSPLLEREFARNAGIGWQGKNTMLINQKMGSYFFIGEIITDQPSDKYDAPVDDRCGTCTKCLDSCPPQAFNAPYSLNSNLCTSYQTIEKRDKISTEAVLQEWLYGCDICQQVCPWNKSPTVFLNEMLFTSTHPLDEISLQNILELTDESFKVLFKNSAAKRIKRKGLIRNALALWQVNPQLAPAEIINHLRNDESEEVRRHAEDAWQNVYK
jgi:epoxyqueuosine reductase